MVPIPNLVVRHRRVFFGALMALGVVILGYWFFSSTARGGSVILYAVGGFRAPLSIRMGCVSDVEQNMNQKFSLPLDVDSDTKDVLKGFWYYSFLRQCLHNNSYDFNGKKIDPSTITYANGAGQYTNTYAGIGFSVPDGTRISVDNALNVNVDDQLFRSELKLGDQAFHILSYAEYADAPSFDDLMNAESTGRLASVSSAITGRRVSQEPGAGQTLWVNDQNGSQGAILVKPGGGLIYIYANASSSEMMEHIVGSAQFLK